MERRAAPADEVTCDALTGAWRIYQRRRGHRFSTDDLLTAWYAAVQRPGVRRILDLGSGIGSVPMMLAYLFPDASIDGVEAQEQSFALAVRSLEHNGLVDRVRLRLGDLRDRAALAARYPLVTGTPPYIPPGKGRMPLDAQKAHCRFELRGGVEDYAATAAQALEPGGTFVLCFDARHPGRVEAAARAAGLYPARRRDVIPRAGRDPLFSLFALDAPAERPPSYVVEPPLVVRDTDGRRTDELKEIRTRLGMPPTD